RVVNNVVVDRRTVINVNQVNVYRNVTVRNAVVAVREDQFGRGAPHGTRISGAEVQRLQPIRGPLHVRPDATSFVASSERAARPPEAALSRPVVATRRPMITRSPDRATPEQIAPGSATSERPTGERGAPSGFGRAPNPPGFERGGPDRAARERGGLSAPGIERVPPDRSARDYRAPNSPGAGRGIERTAPERSTPSGAPTQAAPSVTPPPPERATRAPPPRSAPERPAPQPAPQRAASTPAAPPAAAPGQRPGAPAPMPRQVPAGTAVGRERPAGPQHIERVEHRGPTPAIEQRPAVQPRPVVQPRPEGVLSPRVRPADVPVNRVAPARGQPQGGADRLDHHERGRKH